MKNPSKTTQILFALTLAMGAGCDDPEGELNEVGGEGEVSFRPGGGSGNGILFNTNKIGKHMFAELDTTGALHDGVVFKKVVTTHGVVLDTVWAEAGKIVGTRSGVFYDHLALVGSRWTLTVDMEGVDTHAELVLTSVTPSGSAFIYNWTHTFDGGPKEPVPTCDEDPDHPGSFGSVVTGGITVNTADGVIRKRPQTIYIGCMSGGVGKAGYWGYPEHVVGLVAFETAVRMVRADYCGNGVSFTKPGNPVEISDAWGIHGFPLPGAKTEAIWGKKGAACIGTPRYLSEWPDASSVKKACDEMGGDVPDVCGAGDDLSTYGAMFWTKNP